jgi:hypothetical protein
MSFRSISILTLCSAEPWVSSGVFQGLPQTQFLYNKTGQKIANLIDFLFSRQSM